MRSLVLSTLVLVVLGLGAVGGVVLDRQVLIGFVPPSNIPADAMGSFQLMAKVWNIIFLRPERVEAYHSFTQGQFEDIGAYVETKGEEIACH